MEEIKDHAKEMEEAITATAVALYERLSNPRVNFSITIGDKDFDIGNGYWSEAQEQRQIRKDLITKALSIDLEKLITRALWKADEKMRRLDEMDDEAFEEMMSTRMYLDSHLCTDILMDASEVRIDHIEMVMSKAYEIHSSELVNPLDPNSPIIKAQRMSDDELSHERNKHTGGGE